MIEVTALLIVSIVVMWLHIMITDILMYACYAAIAFLRKSVKKSGVDLP